MIQLTSTTIILIKLRHCAEVGWHRVDTEWNWKSQVIENKSLAIWRGAQNRTTDITFWYFQVYFNRAEY